MVTRRQLCFSRLEDEKLIEFIRNNPPLYALHSYDYKNKKLKELIWKKIGEEMDRNSKECKTRWKNIRDNYHRKPKIMKLDSGANANDTPEQLHNGKLELLRFLDSSACQRRPQNAIIQEIVEPQLSEPPRRPPLMLTIAGTDTGTVIAHSISDVEHTLIDQTTDRTKFSREDGQLESASVVPDLRMANLIKKDLMEPVIKKSLTLLNNKDVFKHTLESPKDRLNLACNNNQRLQDDHNSNNSFNKDIGDHLDMFFKAMAATVRNFPPNLIIEAKRKVFMVINDMESTLDRIAPGRELSFLAASPVKSEISSSGSELPSPPSESNVRFFSSFEAESNPSNRVRVLSQQVLSPGIIEQYLETNLSQESQPPPE